MHGETNPVIVVHLHLGMRSKKDNEGLGGWKARKQKCCKGKSNRNIRGDGTSQYMSSRFELRR